MASARATTLAQAFSQRLLKEMYERSLARIVTNSDYQGEVNGVGSKINILNLARISEKDYTGANLSVDDIYENNSVLTIEKQKAFYWRELTIENWKSYIKDPHSTIVAQKADERNQNMDIYVLGFYGDVASGNRVGTDYTTGTVTIDSAGNVTGSGTTFTSGMVGKGFKADGHTKWYRVKSFGSATAIVIEDDLDDVASAYTGGAIAGGASYTIQANTAVAVTKANLLSNVAKLKKILDAAGGTTRSNVPDMDRYLIVPPDFEEVLVQATGIALHVPAVYEGLVKQGFITQLQGFNVMKSNRVQGDNTNGWHVLAIQKNWLTFAEKNLAAVIEEDLDGNFGSAYKDLFVYGGKVPDSRRHFAAELFCTFSAN